jgi:hypothetical protein
MEMNYNLFTYNEHYAAYEFIKSFITRDDAEDYAYTHGMEQYFIQEVKHANND